MDCPIFIRCSLALILVVLLSATRSESIGPKCTAPVDVDDGKFPQEKLYLHTDRKLYLTGDTIWFTAYLLTANTHTPSPLSKVIYVDLMDHDSSVVESKMLHLDTLATRGQIAIHEDLPTGTYTLIAYTNWMANASSAYFFAKKLTIRNPKRLDLSRILHRPESKSMSFFPEGGRLIEGLKSNLGVKVLNRNDQGIACKGIIKDNLGNSYGSFVTNVVGMGQFSLVPEPDRTYHVVDVETGEKFDLPSPSKSGYVMTITNKVVEKVSVVKLQSNVANPGKVTIIAHVRGQIQYAAEVNHAAKINFIKIATDKFPTGILTITAIDQNGNPIAERLIFVDNEDRLSIAIKANKKQYHPYERVNLQIRVTDKNGAPIKGRFSLSAVDQSQDRYDNTDDNIVSNLLLTSDLRGRIESPAMYFDVKNKMRSDDINVLLLTQGWRRFDWLPKSQEERPKPVNLVEQAFALRGKVNDKFNDKPIKGGTIMIMGSTSPIQYTKTNENGEYTFENLTFYDSTKTSMVAQKKNQGTYVKISLERATQLSDKEYKLFPNIESDDLPFFEQQIQYRKESTRMLDEIVITASRAVDPRYTELGSSGTLVEYDEKDVSGYSHVLQLIQGRYPGVNVFGAGLDYRVTMRGFRSSAPTFYLDNMLISEEMVGSIDPHEVSAIRIVHTPSSKGNGGAILFFQRRGPDGKAVPFREGILDVTNAGFQVVREFYSPSYQNGVYNYGDHRATLYWNPSIETNADGKATVSFYCTKDATEVHIQVEGTSYDGLTGVGGTNLLIQ